VLGAFAKGLCNECDAKDGCKVTSILTLIIVKDKEWMTVAFNFTGKLGNKCNLSLPLIDGHN